MYLSVVVFPIVTSVDHAGGGYVIVLCHSVIL